MTERVGKGKPPTSTRFKPGHSGNPNGRPRGRHRFLPYETILGQLVTVVEDGVPRQLTADQALLLQLANKGLAGNGVAARLLNGLLETAQRSREENEPLVVTVRKPVAPGSVNSASRTLRMATLLDPYRPGAHIKLEPWLVEAALARLGTKRLTRAEQEIVLAATRTPNKVHWPEWWEACGRSAALHDRPGLLDDGRRAPRRR